MNTEYTIKTVIDFAAIPADKIAACLSDFEQYLGAVREMAALNDAFSALLGVDSGDSIMKTNTFIWIDDGVSGVSSVQFVDKQGAFIGRMSLNVGDEHEPNAPK